LYHKAIQALVAFRQWRDDFAHYGRARYGLANVLHAVMTNRDFQETYALMVNLFERIGPNSIRSDL
jgi:hypothetical protein